MSKSKISEKLDRFWEKFKTEPKFSILRMIVSIFIIILGILGIFLPILQGILLITIGVSLLLREIRLRREGNKNSKKD